MFCDEPLLLIQCAAGDLFHSFVLFIVFLKKLFLGEEGLNHGIFLQVTGYIRMAFLVVFLYPVLLNIQDVPRGSSAPNPFIIKPFFQTFTIIWIILIFLYSLTVGLHVQFDKEQYFCLDLLSCPFLY